MIAIITSAGCPAGETIKKQLLKQVEWQQKESFDDMPVYTYKDFFLYTIKQHHIHAEELDKRIPADLFLFATTHKSTAGKNALSVHSIGNWGNAEYGGRAAQLGLTPALLVKKALVIMEEATKELPYEVIQEATHHGPYLTKPALFLEIGCDEASFRDERAGEVIATTLLQLHTADLFLTTVGIGGLHHAPNFKSIQLRGTHAVGHVCPRYALSSLNPEIIKQAMQQTSPTAVLVLVDWKGLGTHKSAIVTMLEEANIPWKRITDVKRDENL